MGITEDRIRGVATVRKSMHVGSFIHAKAVARQSGSARLTKCTACEAELPADAKFCPACGTQVGLKKDTFQVTGDALVGKVKEIVRDASVKRIVVKDDKGQMLVSIPVTWGAAGAVATVALAPWLAALGVIAALVARVTVEVERSAKP